MARKDSMEEPSRDDEDSACIGEEKQPERTYVQTDADSGPDADKVYGKRWS